MSNDDIQLIAYSTYLNRLSLRSPIPADYAQIASILSSPQSMKHLSALAPPGGWADDRPKGIWLVSDVAARAAEHRRTHRETLSCILNAIINETGEVLGSTGFPRMEAAGTTGRKAELGIVFNVDDKFARKGYATEALHGCIRYAFEELEGVEEILLVTSVPNQEMRGWLENVAGLKVKETFDDRVRYSFTRTEWGSDQGVRKRLEMKMDRYK